MDPPSGCRFRTRCPLATERCASETPLMREVLPGRFAACHHPILDHATSEERATEERTTKDHTTKDRNALSPANGQPSREEA
jgi:hypothetical protein